MASVENQLQSFQQRLGLRVKARRKAAKLGQKELAYAAGYETHTMISEIENGTALPAVQKLVGIANALGCTLEELLGGAAQENVYRLYQNIVVPAEHWQPESRKDVIAFFRAMADQLESLSA